MIGAATPPRRRGPGRAARALRAGRRASAVLAVSIAAWWLAVTLLGIPAYLLPGPDIVAGKLLFLARAA
ncbi:MAG: hypothetical protein FJX19_11840 [Alphaproteobacteria bacterium]|nr:hypothetical protein [Alphaproteobacteria bacterium]